MSKDKFAPQDIVTMVIASLSLLGTILTVAYVKAKSNFTDNQGMGLNIKNIIERQDRKVTSETVMSLDLTNTEAFVTKKTSFKNGDKDNGLLIQANNLNKNFLTEVTIEKGDNEEHNNNTNNEVRFSDFRHALDNNHSGDKIIGTSRDNITNKAVDAFKQIVTSIVKGFVPIAALPEEVEFQHEDKLNVNIKNKDELNSFYLTLKKNKQNKVDVELINDEEANNDNTDTKSKIFEANNLKDDINILEDIGDEKGKESLSDDEEDINAMGNIDEN